MGRRLSAMVALGMLVGCPAEEPVADDAGPVSTWTEVEPTARYGAMAADVSWATLSGSAFHFSDDFTGSQTHLVVLDVPGASFHTQLWEGRIQKLLNEAGDDVHLLFGSWEEDDATRLERLTEMQADVHRAIGRLESPGDWLDRVHFVLTWPGDAEFGWPGELGAGNIRRTDAYHAGVRNVGFAVDPRQRIRPLGELVDFATGEVRLDFLANLPAHYAFEIARDAALEAEEALVVPLWTETDSGTGWGGEAIFTEVELPDLSAYDTLHLDLTQGCHHVESITDKDGDGWDDNSSNPRAVGDLDCPEWDRLTDLQLCEVKENEDDAEVCTTEIGRWVTAYTAAGRWVHDISPLLGLLSEGRHRFRYKAIDNHPISLSLRFTTTGQPRAVGAVPLYAGGQLTACTNDRYAPMEVEIPAGVSKVELAAVISGHSFGKESKNCGEFCNHEHHFEVGGQVFTEEHPEATEVYACLDGVGAGVVPNQYGSWIYGRAGWCPGQEVSMWRTDVTDVVSAGSPVTVDYEVTVDGATFDPTWTKNPGWDCASGKDAGFWVPEFEMSSWLVFYE